MSIKFERIDNSNLITNEPYDEIYSYIKSILISANGKIQKDDKNNEILEASWRYGLNLFGLRVIVKFRKINDDKIEINFKGGFKDSFDTTGAGTKKANEIMELIISGKEVHPGQEEPLNSASQFGEYIPSRGKSKGRVALFALLLGGVGAHKFYLGNWGIGIVFIVSIFILPMLSLIIGVIEGIRLFTLSEKQFDEKYNYKKVKPFQVIW